MSGKQALNPYLPSWEYVPDAEPHVVDGRVYIYGSHDQFNGRGYCPGDYVCWSAPVDDLGDWRYEGCIYQKSQDPAMPKRPRSGNLYAPDMVQGPDGKFYLYYFMTGTKKVSVAVCDEPAGQYEYYGSVKYADNQLVGEGEAEPIPFDPGVFLDEDGKLYLYAGFSPDTSGNLRPDPRVSKHGPMCFELDATDMLTVVSGPTFIGVPTKDEAAAGSAYEKHPFYEASSMRKFDGTYYFIYSSLNSHELCYATGDAPTGPFQYGGVLISNGDIGLKDVPDQEHAKNDTGNTHGSVIEINGNYYVFYHRHSNRHQYSRQACAEKLVFEKGKFRQAEMTSCGLNDGPLAGEGNYPAYIACNLYGRLPVYALKSTKYQKGSHPYLTQEGEDREEGPDQYIANMCNGSVAGFKYFDLTDTTKIRVNVKGNAKGILKISTEEGGAPAAELQIKPAKELRGFSSLISVPGQKQALYFTFEGTGSFDFISFDLK